MHVQLHRHNSSVHVLHVQRASVLVQETDVQANEELLLRLLHMARASVDTYSHSSRQYAARLPDMSAESYVEC